MGVKDLFAAVEMMDEEKEVVVHSLPLEGSVVFDDFPVRLNKLAVVEYMEFSDLIAFLMHPYKKFFRAPNARILWIGVDGKKVTKRKRDTQDARSAARTKRMIFPYPDTVYCTEHGLKDSTTGVLTTKIDTARLACSRHIRSALATIMWDELCKCSLPDHAFVFFDAFDDRAVPMLHGGRVVNVHAAAEVSAEAEVRNVIRAKQMLEFYRDGFVTCTGLPSVPLKMVLKTVDADTLPLVVEHFWDTVFPDGVTLSFLHKADIHMDVIKLIAMLKKRGWTWQMFKAGCILSETDYSYKSDYTAGIGHAVTWEAWDKTARNVPADVRTNMFKLMEMMICTAYVAKIKEEYSRAPSNRSAMLKCVAATKRKALQSHIFTDKAKEARGRDNYMWLWDYWSTLGRYASPVTRMAWPLAPAAPIGYEPTAAVHHKPAWQFGGGGGGGGGGCARRPDAVAVTVHVAVEWVPDSFDVETLVPMHSGAGTARDVELLCDDLL